MYESDKRYYGYGPKDTDYKEYEANDECEPKCEPKEKENEPDKEFNCRDCELYEGNSVSFDIKRHDCEIRADIIVKKNSVIRVWGRVKSCYDEPVEGALVKLVKVVCWRGRYQYVGLAHTITDCKGFYQFDICDREERVEYRVIVSKAATGKERVIGSYGSCRYGEFDSKAAPQAE